MENIMVSICCITYNHEKYIAEAIEGFLMQKTSFKFEILIHDDASTDDTAKIIKKYEDKYPDLIKVIYQKENQYSKGVKISDTLYKKSKGKYIALCEGDDYWIDPYKLQKQVEYLENNEKCTFCFTNAIKEDLITNKKNIFVEQGTLNKQVFKLKDFDFGELGVMGFIPTASFIFPRKNIYNMPKFYFSSFKAGDFKLKLACAYQGYAHFINEPMTVYRCGVENSVTTIWGKEDSKKAIERNRSFINLIEQMDEETKYMYQKNLDRLKIEFEKNILFFERSKRLLLDERYLEYYEDLSLKKKIIMNLYLEYPNLYNFLKRIKSMIKG